MNVHGISSRERSHIFQILRTSVGKDDLRGSELVWLGGTIGSIQYPGMLNREQLSREKLSQILISRGDLYSFHRMNIQAREAFAAMVMWRSHDVFRVFSEDMTVDQLNTAVNRMKSAAHMAYTIEQEGLNGIVYVMTGSDKLEAVVKKANEDEGLKEILVQKKLKLLFLISMDDIGKPGSDVYSVIKQAANAPKMLANSPPGIYVQSIPNRNIDANLLSPFISADELTILPWDGVSPNFASVHDSYYMVHEASRKAKKDRLIQEFNTYFGEPTMSRDEIAYLDVTPIVANYDDFIESLNEREIKVIVFGLCHSGSMCGVGDVSIPKLINDLHKKYGIKHFYGAPINGQPSTMDYPSCHEGKRAGLNVVSMDPEVLIEKLIRTLPMYEDPALLANKIYESVSGEIATFASAI